MVKLLVISDLHYPERGNPIPILEKLRNYKFDYIIGVGDYGEMGIELLKKYFPEHFRNNKVTLVKGNCDSLSLPEEEVIEINQYRVGIIHGHQVEPRGNLNGLYYIASKLKANILLNGHTHIPLFTYYRGVYFLNPGSAGGAISGEGIKPPNSAAILELNRSIKVNLIML